MECYLQEVALCFINKRTCKSVELVHIYLQRLLNANYMMDSSLNAHIKVVDVYANRENSKYVYSECTRSTTVDYCVSHSCTGRNCFEKHLLQFITHFLKTKSRKSS